MNKLSSVSTECLNRNYNLQWSKFTFILYAQTHFLCCLDQVAKFLDSAHAFEVVQWFGYKNLYLL